MNIRVMLFLVMGLLIATVSMAQHHEHHAPHGGTLIVLGDESAHMEIVINQSAGDINAYILDAEAENPIIINQESLTMKVLSNAGQDNAFEVKLNPVENILTGETLNATSQYFAQNDKLININEFDGEILSIAVNGYVFKNVRFNFPEGNEHAH